MWLVVCVGGGWGGGAGGGTAILPASSVNKGAGRNDAALSGDSPTLLHVQNHYITVITITIPKTWGAGIAQWLEHRTRD